MKKNLILMTALFAGTMLINDGLALPRTKVVTNTHDKAPVETVQEPNYQEQLAETRGELENTKKECEDLKKQLSDLQNLYSALGKQNKDLQMEKLGLEETVKDQKSKIDDFQSKNRTLNTENTELHNKNLSYEKIISDQGSQLQNYWNALNQKDWLLQQVIRDVSEPFSDLMKKENVYGLDDVNFLGKYFAAKREIDKIFDYYQKVSVYDREKKSKTNFTAATQHYKSMMLSIDSFRKSGYELFLNDALSKLNVWYDVIKSDEPASRKLHDTMVIIGDQIQKCGDFSKIIQESENILRSFTDYFKNEIIIR